MVGASDIADCDTTSDGAVAALLDTIDGTVFTAGDNSYPLGRAEDLANCYEPTWGRHKARTRPSAGNHNYYSPGAAPYYAYFGAHAGPSGVGYYMATLAWSPAGAQTGYRLWTIPLDGSPRGTVSLPAVARRVMHETAGRPTCYVVLALTGAAVSGSSDMLCAIPGESSALFTAQSHSGDGSIGSAIERALVGRRLELSTRITSPRLDQPARRGATEQ